MADGAGKEKSIKMRSGVDRRISPDPIADRPESFMEAWRRAQAEYLKLKTRGPDRRLVRAAKVFEVFVQGVKSEEERQRAKKEYDQFVAQERLKELGS